MEKNSIAAAANWVALLASTRKSQKWQDSKYEATLAAVVHRPLSTCRPSLHRAAATSAQRPRSVAC
ncbi:hypothetical protein GQ600_8489 [Phytophthora cactorum]|nr:hypothetical protein GQ600_8489 [Phytophthora cactorum]